MDHPASLTQRHVARPGEGWLGGPELPSEAVALHEYDPDWKDAFERHAKRIRTALRHVARRIEHVGSTSVPGLVSKPIIDIDLWVDDSDREEDYLPALVKAGYVLVLREPWWNGHRMLVPKDDGAQDRVNLHVFPSAAPEAARHILFRDWLRIHGDDRDLYATMKRRIAADTASDPGRYNLAKNDVIDEIYGRVFSVPPHAHPAWASLGVASGTTTS
jgi:GrpB-like predicted nucleotidyltransferase (UPF0157 family)